MSNAFLTIAIPFNASNEPEVNRALDGMGNPAGARIRKALNKQAIHFMSIVVIPADNGELAHLMFEVSADGTNEEAIKILVERLGEDIWNLITLAGIRPRPADLATFLKSHSISTRAALFGIAGLPFTGTPGISVARIRAEHALANKVRSLFDRKHYSGTRLEILLKVREEIAQNRTLRPLLVAEYAGFLANAPTATAAGFLIWLVTRGLFAFTWPYLAVAGLAVAWATYAASQRAGDTTAIIVFVVASILALAGLGLGLAYLAWRLRRLEDEDKPERTYPDQRHLAEVIERENAPGHLQNHLTGISTMKPGRLRRITLRLAFWVIQQAAAHIFRPGYLGDIGTIHFARWVLVPKTDKLVFFSNFGGSWESYLEDFITKAHTGLTGVWSNTEGFPRTKYLFTKGATDGDRFKRWARRQQHPTRFWYVAYPHLTTDRIRTNAAIRHGLASARTEDEAQAWLTTLGSRLRPASLIETEEVQTVMFGALKRHPDSTCLFVRLPEQPAEARAWVADMFPRVTFGDQALGERVHVVSFTATGLGKLGLGSRLLDEFPLAFTQGMADATRARILGDIEADAPENWRWGNAANPVDAAIVVYARNEADLAIAVRDAEACLATRGGSVAHRVTMKLELEKRHKANGEPLETFAREPFGFADGISQPIMKGTRRWMRQSDNIHVVEPGEFVLGYPDNRGYRPLSPSVPPQDDPQNALASLSPLHSQGAFPDFDLARRDALRDVGRNGTYVVFRQLEQKVDVFHRFVAGASCAHAMHPGMPSSLDTPEKRKHWVEAKMVGRWRDGTSLLRYPNEPGTGWDGKKRNAEPDNAFLLGAEDPLGERCPFGAHIRRANPRETSKPGSMETLQIVNRHRILRFGRSYKPEGAGFEDATYPGLMFMCANADIERQFEFIQQTWVMAPQFGALDNEVDPLFSRGNRHGRLTIPTTAGPLQIKNLPDFVQVLGGGYFFLPGKRTLRFFSHPAPAQATPPAAVEGTEPELPRAAPSPDYRQTAAAPEPAVVS
jgi:deferrochelatase/peroxidase EfeB